MTRTSKPSATFTQMIDGTADDWAIIVREMEEHAKGLPTRLLTHLQLLRDDTGGFAVDLSKIRGLKEVYSGNIIKDVLLAVSAVNHKFYVIPATDNKSSGVKIGLALLSTGVQVAAAVQLAGPTVLTIEVFGR